MRDRHGGAVDHQLDVVGTENLRGLIAVGAGTTLGVLSPVGIRGVVVGTVWRPRRPGAGDRSASCAQGCDELPMPALGGEINPHFMGSFLLFAASKPPRWPWILGRGFLTLLR